MKKSEQNYRITTLLLSKDLWLAAKRQALEEDKPLRKLMAEALTAYLGTKGGRKAVAREKR